MSFDDLDQIMDKLQLARNNLIDIPFILPNAIPGQLHTGNIQFIIRQIKESGMVVELVNFVPSIKDDDKGEELKVLPSPS